jgi:hypothetical protein
VMSLCDLRSVRSPRDDPSRRGWRDACNFCGILFPLVSVRLFLRAYNEGISDAGLRGRPTPLYWVYKKHFWR